MFISHKIGSRVKILFTKKVKMNITKLLKTVVLSSLFCFSITFADLPLDVENLVVTSSGEGSVSLSWDASSDMDGIILGYKVYYGQSSIDESDYYSEDIDTDSSETYYTLNNLENGITYYFSVTALDEEENESMNYSEEVSATPYSEAIETPSVISAVQTSEEEIKISMSEPVAIKSRTQSFFVIEKENPGNEIMIEDAEVDGTQVYLTVLAGSLKTDLVYEITATSAVEDLDGNPVSSGMTDTATFTAKDPSYFIIEDPIIEVDDKDVLEPGETLPEEQPMIEEPVQSITEPEPIIHAAAPETDNIPPTDAANLVADSSRVESDKMVVLTWTLATDTDEDIIDQVLYTKEGNENWDTGYSVGKGSTTEEILVKADSNYMIRIVTIDKSGNQSNGIVTAFSTQLAKTGPSSMWLFVAVLFVGMYIVISTKKRI